MKTNKQIFHLREPQADPYSAPRNKSSEVEPVNNLIVWVTKTGDHLIIWPEFRFLFQQYSLN